MATGKGKGQESLSREGWTRAWRKELKSDIWSMPPLYHRVWFYLRQRANWEIRRIPTAQGLDMFVSPGMLITSYQQIAEGVSYTEYGITRTPNKRTIMKILDWLQDRGMIQRESNGIGTVIKINNWDTYQSNDSEKVTSRAPRSKRGVHTKKNIKELQSLKERKEKIEDYFPEALRLAGILADLILKNNPTHTGLNGSRNKTVSRWAEDIEKLIRTDKQSPADIEAVIRWCQADSFWFDKILSGAKLRKQFNALILKARKAQGPSRFSAGAVEWARQKSAEVEA